MEQAKELLQKPDDILFKENEEKNLIVLVATRIAQKRNELGLTKKRISEILGITEGAYNAYELAYVKTRKGEALTDAITCRIPPPRNLKQIAQLFNCSIDWLLGLTDDADNSPELLQRDAVAENNMQSLSAQNIDEMFMEVLHLLSATQKGILYGRVCEVISDKGWDK